MVTPHPDVELLRLTTAGSVDDGKSTLIGRLLYETGSIFEDQLEAVERASRQRGEGYVNLALLTDGLRAEREQNITIDVAYRYFATPRRRFIIADTPGHIQYTRNMLTGASTAELAVVLVDARKGVLTQSKRHGFLASLLRIPHIVVAVNKMDLVGYDESVFREIVDEYGEFSQKLDVTNLTMIPISALRGDNVVTKSSHMEWYDGSTLLHHLESVKVGASRNLVDFRFPVQCVIRPHQDYRGYAGRVVSGTVKPGEEIVVLPAGHASRIAAIHTPEGPREEAVAGDSVVLTIEDDIDVGRGDMVVRRRNLPVSSDRLDAIVCWMSETPLDTAIPYVLMHTTRQTQAFVTELIYRIDVDTLHREEVATLGLNDIGRVQITSARPLFFDPYERNVSTGSFILIHPHTHGTVAAGMIRGEVRDAPTPLKRGAAAREVSPDVAWEPWNVSREEREARNGHRAAVVWLTGLSGSGKSTIAKALERELFAGGCQTMLLDGDQIRHGLSGDLGFSPDDRMENIRRAGEVARLFFEQGCVVICSFVSPYRVDRERARALLPGGCFFEVHVDCDLETLRRRDPKGLYVRAARGTLRNLTGVQSVYEAPTTPEAVIDTKTIGVDAAVAALTSMLRERGVLPQGRGES
jgi:bifunctional enzyme CysN/CysC